MHLLRTLFRNTCWLRGFFAVLRMVRYSLGLQSQLSVSASSLAAMKCCQGRSPLMAGSLCARPAAAKRPSCNTAARLAECGHQDAVAPCSGCR